MKTEQILISLVMLAIVAAIFSSGLAAALFSLAAFVLLIAFNLST